MIGFLAYLVKANGASPAEEYIRIAMQLTHAKIVPHPEQLTAESAELHTNLVIVLGSTSALTKLPFGGLLRERMRVHGYELGADRAFVTDLPNRFGTRVAVVLVDNAADAFKRLSVARDLIASHEHAEKLAVAAVGMTAREAMLEALVAGALAATFPLPDYRSKPEKRRLLRELHVYGTERPDFARTLAEAKGNNLARFLTALPTNALTPRAYRERVEKIAQACGWRARFWGLKRLSSRGAGAFLAVARGSPERDAGILHLRYSPKGKPRATLALVGKGICYDTGGTNLKSAKGMYGMHEDMAGSAAALGTLFALAQLQVDFAVDCWLALAQNHIGPDAYKPNEVVTAANGTSIEVVHTDAEGRMVLADTLHFAAAEKPTLLIDFATLTGACVHALSSRYGGAFTNRPQFVEKLIGAGQACGERIWPFPMDNDFEKELKSDIADIKQCTLDNEADHILAAVFLRRFVGDVDWIHLDLAAANHKGGLAHIPTDTTGFGVRLALHLALDAGLLAPRPSHERPVKA